MARKRPDGDGLVRKRKDGRWEGRIVIGHKEDGTPIYKSVFAKTQKELMPKLHGAIDCYRDADLSEQGNMTLSDWIEQWLTSYAEPTLRESTVRGYRSDVRHHIKPALGSKRLRSITQRDVQKFYNAMGKKTYKASDGSERCLADATVRGVHMLLHEIMEAAVRSRLIVQNPTDGTVIPKLNRPPMKILNEEQLDRFKEAIRAEPLWYDFFYTEITTGLRRGEICGLKWCDLDEESGTLKICRSIHSAPGGALEVGNPKTEKGTRTILLPASTLQRAEGATQDGADRMDLPQSAGAGKADGAQRGVSSAESDPEKRGPAEHSLPRSAPHLRNACHAQRCGRQDALRHPRSHQRQLHAGHLHPRHHGHAEERLQHRRRFHGRTIRKGAETVARKRKAGEGDVCERRRWRVQRAIRSGSNTAIGKQTTACADRADGATGKRFQ